VREEILQGTPIKQLAGRYGVPERTLFRWVFERGRGGGRPRKLSPMMGIDELSVRKGHNYDTHIVDLVRRRTIAVLPGRSKDEIVKWFRSRPKEELEAVRAVVTDMSSVYAAAIREVFGDAVLVIDRFHVVKLAVDALENGARALRKELSKEEAKRMKKLRKLWLRPWQQLDFSVVLERMDWLRRFPQMSEAIEWVQDLRTWFDRRYAKPASAALEKLIERARTLTLEPLRAAGETLARWAEPITHFISTRVTNGLVEGFNTKIKLIQRMAYGLRNHHNRQLRIKAWCGRA
jgi:transposase